ncbi:sugar phosphate isomerase/epimerase [Salinibacterium sp. ZJ70]|uniref:sugar phosphate isomerase/epimerase family protein n=1 Tax=Salinibacterium sp. ZJ70 TaxID=2708084 RepID=UPI0014242112|nr:TIM barrel protein [Salinibacterium sp. ZJ70]
MRDLGIDHLTALSLEPGAFAHAAADAGFASVSVRTIHIVGGEPEWAVPLDATLVNRVRDAGVAVHAIEAVAITEALALGMDHLRPVLEQGAELGAHLLYSFSDDTDAIRCADTLAALAALASEHGLRLVIEPMPYRAVATLPQAAGIIAERAGAGLIVDTLHASRGGTQPADLARLDPEMLAVIQLCDAPSEAPPSPSPSGLHPLLHEARFDRRLPGAGELPLADFVAEMPSGALVTVEAPISTASGDARTLIADVLRTTRAALGWGDEVSAR